MKLVTGPEEGPSSSKLNLTVKGVLAVIAFIYGVSVINTIVPLLPSAGGMAHLLALTTVTGAALATFLLTVFADPGRVPAGWVPLDAEKADAAAGAGASTHVLQVKRRGGGHRFCKKCAAYKPPRAHHCRVCGRCVLRMDHHCHWVANCIGHGNYRAFLLMCLYLTAACLYALLLLLAFDARIVQQAMGWYERGAAAAAAATAASGGGGVHWSRRLGWRGPFWAHAALQVLATALALPCSLGLAVLLGWNAWLLVQNTTTIEHHEGVFLSVVNAGGRHPYDLGTLHNLHALLGDAPLSWLLLLPPAAEGDGLTFPHALEPSRGGGGDARQRPAAAAPRPQQPRPPRPPGGAAGA